MLACTYATNEGNTFCQPPNFIKTHKFQDVINTAARVYRCELILVGRVELGKSSPACQHEFQSCTLIFSLHMTGRRLFWSRRRQPAGQWGLAKGLQPCHLPSTINRPRIVTTPKNIPKLRSAIVFQDPFAAQHGTIYKYKVWEAEKRETVRAETER